MFFLRSNKKYYYVADYNKFKSRQKSTFDFLNSIKHKNIFRIYPHKLFCNKQITKKCITHDNENIYFADKVHPSIYGSHMITDLILQSLNKLNHDIKIPKFD